MTVSVAGASASMFGGGSQGGSGHFTGGVTRKKKTEHTARALGGGMGPDVPQPQRSKRPNTRGADRTPQGPPGGGGKGGPKKKVVRHGSPRGSVSRTSTGTKSRGTSSVPGPKGPGGPGGGPGPKFGPKAAKRRSRILTTRSFSR
jgi:hypothetical protein